MTDQPNRTTRSLALVSLVALLLSCSQQKNTTDEEDAQLRWDLSLWGKPRAGTVIADSLSRLIHERSDGKWELRVHYGEALSKARENLDGISVGAFEAAMVCNFYHPQKNPALMALSLPFLPIESWEDNRRVREAVYEHAEVKRELARWNAMAYTSSMLPLYEVMGRGDAPLTLESWDGLTVRAGGGIGLAMAKLGATPTSSTATEVYTGVQQGTMNAASFPFTYGFVSYRIHEVSDWYTANLSPGTADCPIVFSISAYEELPDVYKQILEDIKEQAIAEQIQAYQDVDKINLELLQANLQPITYSAAQLNDFRSRAGSPVIREWIAEHEAQFDAEGLVRQIYAAVGKEFN